MKKIIVPVATLFVVVMAWGMYCLMTRPLIERIDVRAGKWGRPDVYVGGEWSHADVKYVDRRPIIARKQEAADVWWGTIDGELRRLEGQNGFTHASWTVCVLRDIAYHDSAFGVGRGSPAADKLQREFDDIRDAYGRSSFFNRAWIWKVEEVH